MNIGKLNLPNWRYKMRKEMQTKQLSQWLKDSVNCLIDHQEGCGTYKLDDHLAVCVGWSGGYSNEPDESVIQATDDLTYAIDAAIKVWTSDSMRTDLDYINAPYYENGDVIDIGVSISKNEDYDKLAEYFLKEIFGKFVVVFVFGYGDSNIDNITVFVIRCIDVVKIGSHTI